MLTKQILLTVAKKAPKGDESIKWLLLEWIRRTSVVESHQTPSIDYVRVAIEHTEVKYRLGFLTKEEVLTELAEEGEALSSDPDHTEHEYAKFLDLVDSVESDTIEFAYDTRKT